MQDDIFNIKEKFGNKKDDINYVYVLARKNNVFDAVYIKYNDGNVNKITKPSNQSYQEFADKVTKFLVRIGANMDNKRKRWNVLTKKNNRGVNFDYLENSYQNSLMSDDVISFNVNKNKPKKFKIFKVDKMEELETLEDEYAVYKVNMIRDIIAAAALTFVTFSPIEGPWSYFNLKSNVTYTVDALLAISAMINGIIMYGNQKIRKKIEISM